MEENDEYRPVGGGAEILRFARAASGDVMDEARRLLEAMVGYKDLRMMYSCALKEVRTKFEVLNMEFNVRHRRNPISSINTRLKSNQSIMEKMRRRSVPFSLENLQKHIQDVAGVRVICSYVDDIYLLSEALLRQDDIALLARKDYIRHPKPNGYRSLHLIVRVPVFFADQKRELPVEVQIRTIAMDFWASLEHQLRYKEAAHVPEELNRQLLDAANRIAALDGDMQRIHDQMAVLANRIGDLK